MSKTMEEILKDLREQNENMSKLTMNINSLNGAYLVKEDEETINEDK